MPRKNPSKFNQKSFDYIKNQPFYWENESQLMYRSSRLLFERQAIGLSKFMNLKDGTPLNSVGWTFVDVELVRPALMLTGFAVELRLKAGALKRGITFDQLIKKSHKLRELAELAEFTPDESERELLDLMERAIVWSGRYPVPKNAEKYDRWRIEDLGSSLTPKLAQETEALYEKLRTQFREG